MAARARFAMAAVALAMVAAGCAAGAGADEAVAPSFEGVTLVDPSNGDVFTGPVRVAIDTGTIDTSGETVPYDYGGRFHLLVDRDCVENGDPLPVDEPGHYAFESGKTEMTVDLAPGAHELCVQFGNAFDIAFYSEDSATIRVAA
jgi:Domain of unknown function (DUF4399)